MNFLSLPKRARQRTLPLFACLAATAACLNAPAARATDYYWDINGTAAGAGAQPSGNWDSTDSTQNFFNTSSSGGAGTFTNVTTATDTVQFSAGPDVASSGTTSYTVNVIGTQNARAIYFRANSLTTLTGGTINLGADGITSYRNFPNSNTQASSSGFNIASTLNLTATQTWTASAILNPNGNTISGPITGNGDLSLVSNAGRIFTITNSLNMAGALSATGGNGASAISISGAIGNNVTGLTVNMMGGNTLTLSNGNNAYSGTTLVSSGTLILTNTSATSATSAGVVNLVPSGAGVAAIISGTGRSTGLLTVASGGQISPGTSAVPTATLTLGAVGGVALNQATLNFNLASTAALASDKILAGNVTLGALTFNFSPTTTNTTTALQTGVAYTLIDGASPSSLDLSNTTFATNFSGFGANSYTATYSTNTTGDLLVTFSTAAVPEPSTWAIALLSLAILGWRGHRRLRSV